MSNRVTSGLAGLLRQESDIVGSFGWCTRIIKYLVQYRQLMRFRGLKSYVYKKRSACKQAAHGRLADRRQHQAEIIIDIPDNNIQILNW